MLKIREIKVPITEDNDAYLQKQILKRLKITASNFLSYAVLKKSIDARDKNNIYFIYEVKVEVLNEKDILAKKIKNVLLYEEYLYQAPLKGNIKLKDNIVIVGSGPAGLFCAYILAENGYKPLIIERGKPVEERKKDVECFWRSGKLNENSNVLFGEGGAGTFSDGKLNTMIKDKEGLGKKVLETFVRFGAPKEILYLNKPHIGTDNLEKIVKNMREYIKKKGGKFYFSTTFTDIQSENNHIKSITLNDKETLSTEVLVLALGHSSRDTFYMLNKKLNMQAKPYAVGIRISHMQEMINKSQYGDSYKLLPPADYKLTYKASTGRGVYSFCMCPGGFVVNSSSEDGALVINGMSNFLRNEENANSAIVVTVSSSDFGDDPIKAIKYQEALERKAFEIGYGKIPTQRWEDYVNNVSSTHIGKIKPVFKGDYYLTNLNEIFPAYINDSLKEAISYFATKIKGFDNPDTLISAVESRTSSPVKIIRDENYEASVKGIYPCGEGAGYAGGITSSAIDGIKVAHAIIEKYMG